MFLTSQILLHHITHNMEYAYISIFSTLHDTALHYTTLHYTTLHYTTLHYTTRHFTSLHYAALSSCCFKNNTCFMWKYFTKKSNHSQWNWTIHIYYLLSHINIKTLNHYDKFFLCMNEPCQFRVISFLRGIRDL